jgi:hypothetical protein
MATNTASTPAIAAIELPIRSFLPAASGVRPAGQALLRFGDGANTLIEVDQLTSSRSTSVVRVE